LCVTRASAHDHVCDRESIPTRLQHRSGIYFEQISTKISGKGGKIRYVSLPAPVRPAHAWRSVDIKGSVSELARHVIVAAHELPVEHDADADTIRDANVNEAGWSGVASCPEPHLRQGARTGGVLDVDREADRRAQRIAQTDIAPVERGSIYNLTSLAIYD